MDINPINPVTLAAGQPGQTITRQVVVNDVSQAAPTTVELSVDVTAAGNGTVSTPVSVTLDPEDASPTASVNVPSGAGVTAVVGGFAEYPQGDGTSTWKATLHITTV